MKLNTLLALTLSLSCCWAINSKKVGNVGTFSWYNCGFETGTYINDMSITPDPIVIPGVVVLSVNATYQQEISVPTTMAVLLERYSHNDSAWEPFPCFGYTGSCVYDDVCSFLDYYFPYYNCPSVILESGLNCTCPIPPGTYAIENFVIPLLVPLPGEFLAGDYRAHITWNQYGSELFCLDLYTTLAFK